MRARIFLITLLSLFGVAVSHPVGCAMAQPGRDGVQPLDRLLPGIRRAHPGNFYDAEGPTYGPQGDPHYHLKWLTPDGRVVWYDTDARSGRVLRTSPGRDNFDGPPPPGYARPFGGGAPGGYGQPAGPGGPYPYARRFSPGQGYASPYGGFRPGGGYDRGGGNDRGGGYDRGGRGNGGHGRH
jgi:hypothetical protein